MSKPKKSADKNFRNNYSLNPFTSLLNGKIVFVGIGNSMRGDDGLGPVLVERLKDKVDSLCINGGDVPENYFGKIVKEQPDTVVLIDAVELFLHSASPSILMEYLGRETGAEVYMLGVQPNSVHFGDGLSVSVKHALAHLEKLILEALRP